MDYPNADRRDIFDTLPSWLTEPQNAYASWIGQLAYRKSTQIVYQAMFSRFCAWLKSEDKRLDQCEMADIQYFLGSKNPNLPESRQKPQTSRQRQQYVRQLERVFAHLGELGLNTTNPGREAGYEKIGHGRDQATRFLTSEEREAVIVAIHDGLAAALSDKAGSENWIGDRDRAMVAVLLGAGLKVSHLGFLTLNCIDLTEKRIEFSNKHYTHRARILDFALPSLQHWLAVQREVHGKELGGEHPVFEADRSAGFGRRTKTPLLHPSGIHRRTQRFLEAAGITGERASAQTLRNTYAGLLIDAGASDDALVDFLGLRASITAQRLRTNYLKRAAV